MKIGILTQPLHSNYGGLLQNYALQQTLIRLGHVVETIDWEGGSGLRAMLYRMKVQVLHTLFPNRYPLLKYMPNDKEKSIIQRNTNHFINTYINHTEAMHSYEEFVKQASKGKYDAYVVGSDQCWRPCYNAFLPSMFLDFVQDKQVKRIAYAASFGTDKWEFTPQQTAVCVPLAKKFDMVSVREDSGVKLCKEHLGVDAVHVLDPTMLLTKEEYIQLIEKEKEPKSNGTLFNYILDPDAKKSAFIQKVAKAKGLKAFQVLPKCQAEIRTKEDVKERIEDCVFPGVTTWLRAFMDTEITIVDSFHGMVFSIIFNKPFWAIGNVSRGMSRFTSLLKMFHLEDRLLDADNLDDVDFSKPVDWTMVNGILEEKRRECKNLLLTNLNE
ncbi:polysaccharide pyruvyl transferase family protein [Prevotellamassilia timonensis]|uniref:polysaccharide pyruvyl transferase family protein n=1 Tax=Prevotellamassilia timonensis TaxID=1852370 RepID=UPI003FEDCF80